jgi:Flp pilus assembly protein TadD
MRRKVLTFVSLALAAAASVGTLQAGDLKINIPRHSSPTPVQRLNQEGVEEVRKHKYEKAETLFYKAYLYDPGDPFTLNNLGYISELQGQIDRAQTFYNMAAQQASNAEIARASSKKLEGKPMRVAISDMRDATMRVNRDNVEAIRLLSKGRGPEADQLLQETLAVDPKNPFTLNNLGVTKEEEGDLEGALKYYTAAANLHSDEAVVVTLRASERGNPVSKMAEESARKVSEEMRRAQTPEARANLLALRGVSAVNRNDFSTADKDFREAYKLNPDDAFSLNNAGYVSEMQGDLETAQFFYDKALKAQGSESEVGLATIGSAEGMKLVDVAGDNGQKIDTNIERERLQRRQESGPIQLKTRDNKPIPEPEPVKPQQEVPQPPEPTPPPQPAPHYVPRPPTPMQPPGI